MAVGDYKAGTAWLEIIPSFKGIEGAIAVEAEKIGKQVDATLAKTIPPGLQKTLREAAKKSSEEMEKAGEEGGLKYAGAFAKNVRARFGPASGDIPKIKIEADTSPFDREMMKVRNSLQRTDKFYIRGKISDDTLLGLLDKNRGRLHNLMATAPDPSGFRNARSSLSELEQFASMVRADRMAGFGGGLHGGAFNRTMEEQLKQTVDAFPKGDSDSTTSAAQAELLKIRNLIKTMSGQRIGIDVDEKLALQKIGYLKDQLDELAKHPTEVQVRTDAAAASKGLDNILKNTAAKAEEAAAKAGDRFNETFGKQVGKAATALPDIKIHADSSDADVELAAIKAQMQDLGKEEIGVSLHEDVAILQIEDMKRRLNDLAKDNPSMQVKADVVGAIAELDEVLIMAGRIDKADPKVNVKVTGKNEAQDTESALDKLADAAGIGGSRLAMLVSIGVALGSVLVPAAGAAAVAVSGIAQAAAAAGAGIGVFALSMSGLGGAIQALDKYENDQAKSAASLTKSQDQVAGAVDSVNSAERSLDNTRKNVADSAKQAAKTVIDAQKSVTDAHKQAERAVKDLQQAYEDARKADEDRALSLRSTELAQRKAVLDLADAKKKLDEIMANPQATTAEREAAKIAYEEQALQIDELSVKHQRLKDEQDKATKSGIEGSTQVVAAREKVQQANDGIQKAEERLTTAIDAQQKQQRDGAFQIASATQAVTNAQRQLEKATVSAGVAGGAALDNLQWAMQQLGPAGASFAKFIYSLKPAFLDLRQTAQSALLPGLQKAIEGLMAYLPQIKAFVGDVGSAVGGIFIDLVDQLGNPSWQRFFGFIRDTAVPSLQGMWRFFSLIAQGVADLIVALSPLNKSMGHGLIDMAEGFARWASTLTMNSGYQKFLDYVAKTGPQVVHLLEQMVIFIIRLVEAAAPMGSTVLNVLVGIFRWVNTLPLERLATIVKVVATFYALLLSLSAVGKVFSVIGTAFEAFGKAQTSTWGGLKSLVSDYRTELDRLNGTVQKVVAAPAGPGDYMSNRLAQLTGGLQETTTEAEKTSRGVSFLNGALATGAVAGNVMKKGLSAVSGFLGGPFGIALLGATILLSSYYEEQAKVNSQADEVKNALSSVATAYEEGGNAAVASLGRTNKAVADLILTLNRYGVSASAVLQAQNGDPRSQEQIISMLESQRNAADPLNRKISRKDFVRDQVAREPFASKEDKDWLKQKEQQFNSDLDKKKALDALIPKLKEQYEQERLLAEANAEAERTGELFAGQMENIKNVLDAGNPTAKQFELAIKNLGDMHIDAASKLDGYLALSDKVATSNLAGSEKAGLFRDVLGQLGSAADTHGPTFDALSGVFSNIADSALSASDKTSLLKQSLDQLYGAAISQSEADENMLRTQADLTTQLETNSAGFDLDTAKKGENRDAILRNRDALEAALLSTREKYVADIAAGESEETARKRHEDMTTTILGQIDPTYRNSAAVHDLVTKYGDIPPERHTKITSEGSPQVLRDLYQGFLFQQALKDGLTPDDELRKWGSYEFWSSPQGLGNQGAQNRADGGPIAGWSPHKRADNIPAWLTAGEWVQPVDSVDYYGQDVMEAMRRRLIPRELLSPSVLGAVNSFIKPRAGVYPGDGSSGIRFADGGQVTENYPVSWQHVLMPVSLAELKGRLDRKEYGWAGPLPQNVKEIQQWLRTQDGKPYIWASAGPTGYDCSGIISAVFNLMRGENPYQHTFSTYDQGRYFTQPGYGMLTAGWTNPGEPGPGGDSVGHTAGMLGGLRFESTGDHVRIGHDTTPLTAFAHLAHAFSNGGLVAAMSQPMLFDNGGRLPAGLGAYLNATGAPENVLTDQQWNSVFELAKRPGQGKETSYHFQFADTTLTPSRLRAMQDADAARTRQGRAR